MNATPPDPIDYQLIGLAEDGGIGDLLAGLDQKQGRIRLQALVSELLEQVLEGLLLAEVLRRVARQKEIIQTGGGTADQTPYLMLLVRPEGIPAYYLFQAALRGLEQDGLVRLGRGRVELLDLRGLRARCR